MGDDAARPQIRRSAVARNVAPVQQRDLLRSDVPPRAARRVRARPVDAFRRAEIGNLEGGVGGVAGEKKVLWLEIPVNDVEAV